MEKPNTVAGLLDKRAELAGLLKFHKAEIRKISVDIDHIDATLKLFQAEPGPERAKRYPTMHRAARGEVIRLVLSMFREAQKPLTSFDIAAEFVRRRGLKTDDATLALIRKRVGACLTKLKRRGPSLAWKGRTGGRLGPGLSRTLITLP